MRSLFRLGPELPGIEEGYRQHYLKQDIDRLQSGMLLWLLAYPLLAYVDYRYNGFSLTFYNLLALCVIYILVSGAVLHCLRTYVTHFKEFDRIALIWALITVLMIFVFNLSLPRREYFCMILDLVGVFSFIIFISSRLLVRLALVLIYSTGSLAILAFYKIDVPTSVRIAAIFSFVVTDLIGIVFSLRMHFARLQEYQTRREAELAHAKLERLASTDPLTGVLNRRRLLELAGDAFYRFHRYDRPFSIMVMDLDGFKKVNDTLGHQQGDNVLAYFSETISSEKREGDSLGRMGGDEFCLVLPETLPAAAAALGERILARAAGIVATDGGQEVRVTVSIGISQAQPGDTSLDSLFSRADRALYLSKNGGRNRMEIV